MSNFVAEIDKGIEGENQGIPLGEGLSNINKVINGVQRGRIYGVAAAPKVGKSTFSDYAFVLQVYLWYVANKDSDPDLEIEWIYFSFEIDRVSKETEFAVFFLYYDHGITHINLPPGVTKNGKTQIPLSPNYLRGRMMDDNEQPIKMERGSDIHNKLGQVYRNRIIPLFGEYDKSGRLVKDEDGQLKRGLIKFIEHRENPTGLSKKMKAHAENYGRWIKEGQGKYERIVGYVPVNPKKYTIVITDHLRKLPTERGWKLKQTVDKYMEYTVEMRNLCQWTFVHIIHLNRSMADVQRMKQYGDMLYPTSDDIKDTGNMSEDADYVFTMFNPNDSRYKLKKHFGLELLDSAGNQLYPNLRTMHLVEARHCEYPQHFRVVMEGGTKSFHQFKPK